MEKFNKNTTYVIGVKSPKSADETDVKYKHKPAHYVLSGERIMEDFDVDNFQDYLRQNPHGYSPRDIVTLSKKEEGRNIWLEESNPKPPESNENNPTQQIFQMADKGNPNAYDYMEKTSKDTKKILQDQIQIKDQRLREFEVRMDQMNDELLDKERKILKEEAKRKDAEQELSAIKKVYDELKEKLDKYLEKQEDAEGLADAAGAVMQNPAAQAILGSLGQMVTAWTSKKVNEWKGSGGPAQTPEQRARQQQQQAQNNEPQDFSTTEGDTFDD